MSRYWVICPILHTTKVMYVVVVMAKTMSAMHHSGIHCYCLFSGKRKNHMKKLHDSN